MNTKAVLTHLIRAARDAFHLEKTLKDIGYKETPYFNLYGEIADAIYNMLGEDTDTFDESVTHAAIHDIFTTDEECAETLVEMCGTDILSEIPVSTRNVIIETAEKRGMDPQNMTMLILSEWAAKELLFRAAFSK